MYFTFILNENRNLYRGLIGLYIKGFPYRQGITFNHTLYDFLIIFYLIRHIPSSLESFEKKNELYYIQVDDMCKGLYEVKRVCVSRNY